MAAEPDEGAHDQAKSRWAEKGFSCSGETEIKQREGVDKGTVPRDGKVVLPCATALGHARVREGRQE